MSHLLQISIGPVQRFIAASRKTRDLATGSWLLVQLVQEAVKCLPEKGLIFPHARGAPAANVILAEVEDDPRTLAQTAREAVAKRLRAIVHQAAARGNQMAHLRGGEPLVDPDVKLDAQADSFLEWFAVWTPIEGDYPEAHRRVAVLMAARKAVRNFGPAPAEPGPRPKSPLDPAFYGALMLDDGWRVKRGKDHRVKDREHLDAVGLVKRFGRDDPSPSTRRVAAASYLEEGPQGPVEELLRRLKGQSEVDEGDAVFGDLDDLPEQEYDKQGIRDVVRDIKRDRPGLSLRPYYAILHADGDGMGKTLRELAKNGPQAHRDFSGKLSTFAENVRAICGTHHATKVYAGGDDVVALCPMDTCLALAEQLRTAFTERVPEATITIGIGIVHTNENLQEAVRFSRQMESLGKEEITGKNALAIGVRPRGGGDVCVCGSWTGDFYPDLTKLMQNPLLSRGFPYEVRSFSEEIGRLVGGIGFPAEDLPSLIEKELIRIGTRKEGGDGYIPPRWAVADEKALKRYADTLLVAHFMTRRGEA